MPDRYWIGDGETLSDSVLNNDYLPQGSIVEFPTASQEHGTLGLNDQGLLTYQPTSTGTFSDSFTYTVANASGRSTAAVQVNKVPTVYLNDLAAPGGNGTQAHPYQHLTEALQAANGQPALFQVAYGSGNADVEDYTLSPGQAVVGQSASARPTFAGTFTMADNTMLKNLKFQVALADGNVRGTDCHGVVLSGLEFRDNASTANAIQLTACGQVEVSNLTFFDLLSDPFVLVNPVAETVVNGASFDNVNGGIVIDASNVPPSSVQPILELNKLKSVGTKRLLKITAANTTQILLHSNGCNATQSDGQSMIEVDVSDYAAITGDMTGWVGPSLQVPAGQSSARASMFNWKTRDHASTQLQLLHWNFKAISPEHVYDPGYVRPDIESQFTFEVRDQAQAGIVFFHSGFDHGVNMNFLGYDQSKMWLRMQAYAQNLADSTLGVHNVAVIGKQSAQVNARFYSPPTISRDYAGINPFFDFHDSSKFNIVRLIGNASGGWTVWREDNDGGVHLGAYPVMNGLLLDPTANTFLNPQNYPNINSVPTEDGLNIPAIEDGSN